MKKYLQNGFSLIELVIFILVTSILSAALFTAFSSALRGPAVASAASQAMHLAVERMELILPQKQVLGFAAFSNPNADPCKMGSTQLACTTVPSGFTIDSNIVDNWGGDTNYKVITVNVTGTATATLTALVADY